MDCALAALGVALRGGCEGPAAGAGVGAGESRPLLVHVANCISCFGGVAESRSLLPPEASTANGWISVDRGPLPPFHAHWTSAIRT